MAAHLRTQIANAVKTAVTGLATTGTRVYPGRVYPVATSKMPGLLIYRGRERISNRTLASRRVQDRTLEVIIEAVATGAEDTVEQTLDQVLKEIEGVLDDDLTLGGIAKDVELTDAEVTRVKAGDSAKPVATLKTTWSVLYIVREGTPDVSL